MASKSKKLAAGAAALTATSPAAELSQFSNVSEVRFYEETLQHIQDDHPEIPILLPSLYSSLSQTITNPTHIESSHTNSFVFVDAGTTNASGDPLRIPVKVIEGTSGLLKSAYFATTANPNVVWRRR